MPTCEDLINPYLGRKLTQTERAEVERHLSLCADCREMFTLGRTLTRRAPVFEDNFDRLLGLHRLSATEASKLLGISVTTLSYWRNGRREPTTDSLRRVCEFFDAPMMWILAGSFQEILPDVERFERVEQRIRGAVPAPSVPAWAGQGKRMEKVLRERAEQAVSPDDAKVRKLQPVRKDS